MISLPCPRCDGEFMQVETENTLDLICLGCRTDTSESRRHLRVEHDAIEEVDRQDD